MLSARVLFSCAYFSFCFIVPDPIPITGMQSSFVPRAIASSGSDVFICEERKKQQTERHVLTKAMVNHPIPRLFVSRRTDKSPNGFNCAVSRKDVLIPLLLGVTRHLCLLRRVSRRPGRNMDVMQSDWSLRSCRTTGKKVLLK